MDKAECIRPLTDGGYIVAGTTCSPDVRGYHSVTGPNTCGDFWLVKLSAPVTVPPKTIIKINPATATGCGGSPLTITASALYTGVNPIYQWKRNGIVVGSDSPVYTDSNFTDNDIVICSVTIVGDCDIIPAQASDTVTVKLKTNKIHPEITITATSTVLCPCTDIIFKATVGNGGASPIYQWLLNGKKTGNNTSVYINNLLKDGDVITCVYSDNTSCVADGSVISNNIQINDTSSNASSVIISASADTICAGTTVTFNANPVNAGANPVYQWTLNNTNSGDNSPTFSSNNLSDGDQVSCLVTIINPCLSLSVNSNILSMTVSSPVIHITPEDTLINVGGQLQLNGIISGSISSFQWAPADQLENPNVLSPTTNPVMDNTTYTLTAESDDGCVASKSVIVKIVKEFYMPNAFTPNGDGKNDVFRIPPAISVKLKEFSIYNQWGTKVFSTEDSSKGWDGTISGKKQAAGVYVYIINATNENGSVFLKGSFIMIR
jgi:gliding motility-associated-like protein